ncbi:MAG: helix-turn-helix domain-containing protein [Clostridia bacterium]|nr:helix-turn-helix domain-containing protein [Clostridia bacterium]
METFGQRFGRFRRAKGLTQEDVAEKLNISPQAVSKWENDLTSPDISVLAEISEMFGVTLDELLGKEVAKPVEVLPPEERRDINKMMLKMTVDSEGDKMRINLPMALVKVFLNSGAEMPRVNGKDISKDVDFEQVVSLAEQGVIGEIMSIDTAEGDRVRIVVE